MVTLAKLKKLVSTTNNSGDIVLNPFDFGTETKDMLFALANPFDALELHESAVDWANENLVGKNFVWDTEKTKQYLQNHSF